MGHFELVPFFQPVLTTGRKLVIGRREIHNSLKKSSRKLSRDHVEILPRIIDGIAKISIKPLGRNPVFTAKYEYPMQPIPKGESIELLSQDLIGFRIDDFIYQLVYVGKAMAKSASNLIPSSIGSATEKFEMMQTNHSDSEVFTSASELENESTSTKNSLAHNLQVKLPCEYAETCYRKNPTHFHERSHPGDSDWWDPLEESPANDPRPECEYGVLCYQKQDFHQRKFKHTKVDCNLRKRKAASKVKKIEIESDSDKFSGTDSEHEWSDENTENFKSENISVTPAKLSREAKELIEDSKFVLRTINCRR